MKTFLQRQAEEDTKQALESLTTSERLLAHILIELMEMRAKRGYADIAARLKLAGLSAKQAAAVMGSSVASLAVVQRRKNAKPLPDPPPAGGVRP